MKKLAIAATGALALAGIGVGVSSAVTPTTTISVKTTPISHGSKKKPKKAKLVVKLSTTPNPADPAFAADTTVVHLAKELQFNGSALKSCTSAQVLGDDTKCPKGSRVGQGTASGTALGSVEPLTVKAFNGPGGNKLLLLVDGSSPLAIHAVIEGVLSSDSAPYGKKLSVTIPPDLVQPVTNVYATLTQFNTTINAVSGKRKGKSVPYVGIQGCPASKKMAFAVDYHYQPDNSVGHAETTAPCK